MGFIVLLFAVILLDQASKFYIQHHMSIGESIPLIEGVLHITYIENPHTAFGLFKYPPLPLAIAMVLVCLILVILIYKKIIFKRDAFSYISLALILGGAIGNLIDRLRVEERVIDFIDLRIWPIFNFADMAIVSGMLILLIHFLFYSSKNEDDEEDDRPRRRRRSRESGNVKR